jgi:putative flippase GtrA
LKNYIKSLFTPTALQQLVKVGLIGVVNTIVSFTLFNVFLSVLGGVKTVDEGFNWEQFWSVALSFIIAMFVSYLLNR